MTLGQQHLKLPRHLDGPLFVPDLIAVLPALPLFCHRGIHARKCCECFRWLALDITKSGREPYKASLIFMINRSSGRLSFSYVSHEAPYTTTSGLVLGTIPCKIYAGVAVYFHEHETRRRGGAAKSLAHHMIGVRSATRHCTECLHFFFSGNI